MTKTKKGLDATTIKLIAVVCMLIDHVAAGLLSRLIDVGIFTFSQSIIFLGEEVKLEIIIYQIMRCIGRLSFPIFCFFIVQGFLHTRAKWKYALRLLLFALISEVPFDYLLFGKAFYWDYQNVYFTLLIGLLTIWLIDVLRERLLKGFFFVLLWIAACLLPSVILASDVEDIVSIFMELDSTNDLSFRMIWLILAVIVCAFILIFYLGEKDNTKQRTKRLCNALTITSAGILLAQFFESDYSGAGVLTIVVMYLLASRRKLSTSISCILLSLYSLAEIPCFVCVPLIAAYNGERGRGMKYFFYAFYPVHLIIIAIIVKALGLI